MVAQLEEHCQESRVVVLNPIKSSYDFLRKKVVLGDIELLSVPLPYVTCWHVPYTCKFSPKLSSSYTLVAGYHVCYTCSARE